jgi:hypothetical protein
MATKGQKKIISKMAGIAAAISTASAAADLAGKGGSKKKGKQAKQIKKTRKILASAGVATGVLAGASKAAQYIAKEVSASQHSLTTNESIDRSQLNDEVAAKVLELIQSGEGCAVHGDDGQPIAAIIPWEHYQKFQSILGILSWVEGLKGKNTKKVVGKLKGATAGLSQGKKSKVKPAASDKNSTLSPESENNFDSSVQVNTHGEETES